MLSRSSALTPNVQRQRVAPMMSQNSSGESSADHVESRVFDLWNQKKDVEAMDAVIKGLRQWPNHEGLNVLKEGMSNASLQGSVKTVAESLLDCKYNNS